MAKDNYTVVQISPTNEHRIIRGRPWYERYQPFSYKLTSRSGTRTELIRMIETCRRFGIKIYADVVFNHMASCMPGCRDRKNSIREKGSAESLKKGNYHFSELFSEKDKFYIPGALNEYTPQVFHKACKIKDWDNEWEVTYCELLHLPDLKTESQKVQKTIANYLTTLIKIGVEGFRIDAAKHIPPKDLREILSLVAKATNVGFEETDIKPHAKKKILIFQECIGIPFGQGPTYRNGRITEFNFGFEVSKAILNWDSLFLSNLYKLPSKSKFHPSHKAVIFIDNHDNQRGHGFGGAVFSSKNNGPLWEFEII